MTVIPFPCPDETSDIGFGGALSSERVQRYLQQHPDRLSAMDIRLKAGIQAVKILKEVIAGINAETAGY